MDREKKNRITGLYVTIGVHAIVLFLFFITLAWTEPDPPIPEYGIEFNLGSGFVSDEQVDDPVQAEEQAEVEEVAETQPESDESETQEAESVAAEESQGQESEDVQSNEAVEASEDINSPDVIEEKVVSETTKKREVEESDKGKEVKTNEATESVQKVEEKSTPVEKPKLDDRAIFKKKEAGSGTGNKGSSLDLTGWDWDFKPNPNDKSTENGMIVFQITIDDEGEIIGVKTIEKTVSPVVEKVYRDAVMDLTFSKTTDNRSVAATSKGRITFIIQSN